MYNYNFFNNELYRNSQNNMLQNVTTPLFSPTEGFNKGNLFSNLYSEYKNYRPVTLRATNERDRMLLELSRIAFAAHELNLYLDLNPNDTSMLTLFNDYRERANQLERQYEEKYGPLSVSSDSLNQSPFMWEQNAWPWERSSNV